MRKSRNHDAPVEKRRYFAKTRRVNHMIVKSAKGALIVVGAVTVYNAVKTNPQEK